MRENSRNGLVDNWLRHIQNLARRREEELDELDPAARLDALCEMNVRCQAENLSRTTVIQDAWDRGQRVDIHSWIYRLNDGRLKNLASPISTGPSH